MGEEDVRNAFGQQQGWSARLGSPFMARLCEAFAVHLDRSTPIGARLLDWSGDPSSLHDAVPLRIAGGLHALVRRGRLPKLACLYPPHRLPDAASLWKAVEAAFRDAEEELGPWLDGPPQTNEVARSAILMAGFAVISERTEGRPIALSELGSSAGLNLLADRYLCGLGGREFGAAGSPVRLEPPWTGPPPPAAPIRIVNRRGVDLHPLDLARASDRERLLAYVWPDQADRLARAQAALALAAADPPRVDRGDAADWLESWLASDLPAGATHLVAHTIAFQYFPAETRRCVAAALARAGEDARTGSPLAWLRFESDRELGGRASLRLTLWPHGGETVLGLADPHVRAVTWFG